MMNVTFPLDSNGGTRSLSTQVLDSVDAGPSLFASAEPGPVTLQFGDRLPALDYQDRPTAFGLLLDAGRLACVRVDRGESSYLDLPGGAVDGDETEAQALVREFIEETGLTVRPVTRLVEAAQYFRKSDGTPLNNRGGIWIVERVAFDAAARVEVDHELVWLDPVAALSGLRHEAHAWAVALWLRQPA